MSYYNHLTKKTDLDFSHRSQTGQHKLRSGNKNQEQHRTDTKDLLLNKNPHNKFPQASTLRRKKKN